MAVSKTKKVTNKVQSEKERLQCIGVCGKLYPKNGTNFYKTTNPDYKTCGEFVNICKKCLYKMCFKDGMPNQDYFRDVLRKINKPFIFSEYGKLINQGFNIGNYISSLNLNSKYKNLEFKDSEITDPMDEVKALEKVENDIIKRNADAKKIENMTIEDGIELEMLKDKWGEDLPNEQLVWMDRQYKKWENDYAINNELDATIVEQIIFEKWYIQKERQEGKPVDKRIETMNKLLKQGNFKKRSNEEDEVESISMYIAEWEKGKPFIKESNTPEFKDPDNFIKLAEVLAGATARTIGKSNQYTDKFDEYYKSVTMDLTNLDNKEDAES